MPAPTRGFTLIEQLAVTVAVGAASVTALPSLLQLRDEAQTAAMATLAASLSGALALNQAACFVTGQQAQTGKCSPVQRCEDVAGLLNAGLPAGYQVLSQALGDGRPGRSAVCWLQHQPSGQQQAFVGLAAGA